MKHEPDLVYVLWRDSANPVSQWTFLEDIRPIEHVCYSVGWLLRRGELTTVLAANRIDLPSPQASAIINIPNSSIISISLLKVGEKWNSLQPSSPSQPSSVSGTLLPEGTVTTVDPVTGIRELLRRDKEAHDAR